MKNKLRKNEKDLKKFSSKITKIINLNIENILSYKIHFINIYWILFIQIKEQVSFQSYREFNNEQLVKDLQQA